MGKITKTWIKRQKSKEAFQSLACLGGISLQAFQKVIITFVLLLCFNFIVDCFASETNQIQHTIRIGCWDGIKYLSNEKIEGHHQGYIPDYLQELNRFLGTSPVRYHFTYTFGTPEKLLQQLQDGSVDAIIGFAYPQTEGLAEPLKIMDVQLTLTTSKQNVGFFYKDGTSFHGKKIGYTMKSTLDIINKYEEENKIDLAPVYYNDTVSLKDALSRNKVEFAILPFYENDDRFKVVDILDTLELFLISKDTNQNLIKSLTQAKHKMQVAFPSFEVDLRKKHAKGIEYDLANNREEQEFLDTGSPIKFAVSNQTNLIQYDAKNEKYVGPYAALIEYFTKANGLSYEVLVTETISQALEQEADVLLGMIESPQIEKQYNLVFTEPYMHGIYSYWADKGKKVDFQRPNRVGSIHNLETVDTYIQNYYPHWDLTIYDSPESGIEAIKAGRADFIILDDIVDGAHQEISEELDRLYDFNVPQLDLSMGVNFSKSNGPVILSLMDRAIMAADSEKIGTIMLNNKLPNYNLQSLIDQYYQWFIWLCEFLFVVVLLIVMMHYRRLHRAAYFDKELKMNNRNYLLRYGGKFCKENTSIIVLDIAKLKQINMLLGIHVGDDIRAYVAEVLKSCSDKGAILAQTSSLNYVVILPYAEEGKIRSYLQCVFSNLSEYKDETVSVTLEFHVGVYQSCAQEDIQTNLGKAELALFESKRQNIRVYFYSQDLKNRLLKEKMIDRKMQKALENEEFQMYLQPQYDSQTGEISGAEALVRWIEADGNVIYPNEFIPYFEQNGFILKLDDYMFEKACKLQRSLLNRGIVPVPIAVNQSRQHSNDENYSERLKGIADRYQMHYNLIEIEVTEYIYGNEKKVLESIDNLKEIGFSVSIDDFGSGYSSLNMLGGKQVDCIKIDKQFLKEGLLTTKTKNVLKAIVSIAKSLNIQCVCEGVETKEQVEFLQEINCNYLQGFYFAKPMGVEEFIKAAYGTCLMKGK